MLAFIADLLKETHQGFASNFRGRTAAIFPPAVCGRWSHIYTRTALGLSYTVTHRIAVKLVNECQMRTGKRRKLMDNCELLKGGGGQGVEQN